MDKGKGERVEVDGMELHVEPVDDGGPDRPVHNALPPRVESWRRRSVAGAVLTGFALGLKQVLEPEREEVAIVMEVSGQPVDDLAVEAQLNDLQPGESVVTVRPWLLTGHPSDDADTPEGGEAGGPASAGSGEAGGPASAGGGQAGGPASKS